MISIDEKCLVRPITKDMAIEEFKDGRKVLAYDGEPSDVIAFQMFYPSHHSLIEVKKFGDSDTKWFADWS